MTKTLTVTAVAVLMMLLPSALLAQCHPEAGECGMVGSVCCCRLCTTIACGFSIPPDLKEKAVAACGAKETIEEPKLVQSLELPNLSLSAEKKQIASAPEALFSLPGSSEDTKECLMD